MDLFLYDTDEGNFEGSVISAAPGATTYFVNCAPGTDGIDCGLKSGMTLVNGPSSFALHVTEADAFTQDIDCKVTTEDADCTFTVAGPEANNPGYGVGAIVGLTDSLTPVTITAGLDKILAAGTATGATSTTTSGTAESAASAPFRPSGIGASASATATSASGSASSSSTTTSGAATEAGQNIVLAGLSGFITLMLGL
ncbi:hypothetical protein Daus18300_012635 [Diaporthe australafricana]|uniref:Uncharacterized protein n=1 Tax=Diaporthe australafricana TaxID=127596 RepID=A0ABR3W229_9PEZI